MIHIDKKHITRGLEGGIIAGLSFGAMLGLTGTLNFISELTHAPVVFLFIVHVIMSIVGGVLFSVLFGDYVKTDMRGLVLGIGYGFIIWGLSVLLISTIFDNVIDYLGTYVFLPSLWAHLLYGFVLGIVYDFVVPDNEQIDK